MTLGSSHGAYTNSDSGSFRSPLLPPNGMNFMHPGGPYALSQSAPMGLSGMGSFYSPHQPGLFQQTFFPGQAPHHASGHAQGAIHQLPHSYDGRSVGQPSFTQAHDTGNSHYDVGRGITNISLQFDQDNNPVPRHKAVKIPHNNRSRTNTAAAHHNHVEVSRIQQGIDVRTTVSPPVSFK